VPNHKSAKKRLLTSKLRNLRNRDNRARMRSAIKVFQTQVESWADDQKTQELSRIYSLLDVQVRKGIIHRNKAARLKSRLTAMGPK